jgi:ubiquinone/menaquinone biosynthesis C-methylase UbiE
VNSIKKFWKTKIRVLLPEWLKQTLSFVGNGFQKSRIFSTTDRNEFLTKIMQLSDNEHVENCSPDAILRSDSQPPARVWWSKQKDWKAKDVTPLRYERLSKFIMEKFAPYLQPDYIVCDMACACGDFSFLIADKVKQIEAFDLSEGMINTAKNIAKRKNINNIAFMSADAVQIKLEENKYDAFLMLGLLTCIDDPHIDGIVKKIHLSMKQKAKLIIKDSLTLKNNTEYVYNYNTRYSAYYHTQKDYISFFENNGFRLIDMIVLEHNLSMSCIFEKQ